MLKLSIQLLVLSVFYFFQNLISIFLLWALGLVSEADLCEVCGQGSEMGEGSGCEHLFRMAPSWQVTAKARSFCQVTLSISLCARAHSLPVSLGALR